MCHVLKEDSHLNFRGLVKGVSLRSSKKEVCTKRELLNIYNCNLVLFVRFVFMRYSKRKSRDDKTGKEKLENIKTERREEDLCT
jgi:hypothetical protein